MFEITPVDVDRVAQGLEGEEGNADGQDDIEGAGCVRGDPGHCTERIDEEVEVFEEAENGEAIGDREPDESLPEPK